MHAEAFIPTMDQFENPGLIELRPLREEPPSHGPDSVRRQTQTSYRQGASSWVQSDGYQRAPSPNCMLGAPRFPNCIPAIFHALGEEICGRSLSCSSRTC
ncbi:hypothetical protein AVEN_255619-1 [Araneus ventricosus]|uniref:Uncharacterized protein n=1 Tax=Araneus ventricosus TaxID=182803 RepID=A0A4Y2UBB6_ARAVE|nr:hypothetical protein AVEN_255619-1 [Araneus ventricosus]